MSEKLRESLSALMDDEANELELERLLSRIGADENLRQSWVRYNMARGPVAGSGQALPLADISRRVSDALQDLPADGSEQSKVPAAGLRQRLLRPVASFAVAASVAAAVIVSGQQLAQLGVPDAYDRDNAVAASASPVGMINSLGATPVQASYGTQSVPVLQPATRTAYEQLARQRMGRYIQVHAEHAALNSPQGLIPFARVDEIQK